MNIQHSQYTAQTNIISFYINSDGYIIDDDGELILDIISQEPIYKHNLIFIDKQLYDVEYLNKLIIFNYNENKIVTILHSSKRVFTPSDKITD